MALCLLAARLIDNRSRQCALSVAGFLMAGFELSGKTALDG